MRRTLRHRRRGTALGEAGERAVRPKLPERQREIQLTGRHVGKAREDRLAADAERDVRPEIGTDRPERRRTQVAHPAEHLAVQRVEIRAANDLDPEIHPALRHVEVTGRQDGVQQANGLYRKRLLGSVPPAAVASAASLSCIRRPGSNTTPYGMAPSFHDPLAIERHPVARSAQGDTVNWSYPTSLCVPMWCDVANTPMS
jgi:hypothetical protein